MRDAMKKVRNENVLDKIDTPEKAYSVGWIATDGSIGKNGHISVEIQSVDKKILGKLEEILELEHSFYYRRNSPTCRISWYSKQMVEDLGRVGIPSGRKSHILKPPVISPRLMRYFWLGVFDGDGSIYTVKRNGGRNEAPGFNITGSKAMCEGAKEYFGIPTKVLPCHDSFIIKRECLIPSFWENIYGKLYDDYVLENGLFLQRKYFFIRNIIDTFLYSK